MKRVNEPDWYGLKLVQMRIVTNAFGESKRPGIFLKMNSEVYLNIFNA